MSATAEFGIILASTSPYRRALLQRLALPFAVADPGIDESCLPGESPEELVRRLSKAKAQAVAEHNPGKLIIGSDQVAVLAGRITGKPENHAAAVEQLQAASGKEVAFFTGLCCYIKGEHADHVQLAVVPFRVQFRTLSVAQIDRYLKKEQPYNCAGSFKSEGLGVALFSRLLGDDPSALMGLPLIRLTTMLEEAGVQVV